MGVEQMGKPFKPSPPHSLHLHCCLLPITSAERALYEMHLSGLYAINAMLSNPTNVYLIQFTTTPGPMPSGETGQTQQKGTDRDL